MNEEANQPEINSDEKSLSLKNCPTEKASDQEEQVPQKDCQSLGAAATFSSDSAEKLEEKSGNSPSEKCLINLENQGTNGGQSSSVTPPPQQDRPGEKSDDSSSDALLTELNDIFSKKSNSVSVQAEVLRPKDEFRTEQPNNLDRNLSKIEEKRGLGSVASTFFAEEEDTAVISNDFLPKRDNSSPPSSEGISSPNFSVASPNLDKIAKFYEKYSVQCAELERLEKQNAEYREQLVATIRERDSCQQQIRDATHSQSAKIQELERKLLEYEYQMKALKDRANAQEQHYRKSIADFQSKHNQQMEQLKKSTESARKEKDESVIKYAQREAEILKLETSRNRLAEQLKQITTERGALNVGLRGVKNEKMALQGTLDQRESDLSDVKKEVERMKCFVKEADIRIKIATQKMEEAEKAEKEHLSELEKCQRRLVEAKEEAETVRADCQSIIKQYQDTEDKKQAEMSIQKQEQSDQQEIHKMVMDELEALKRQHKDTMKECEELRARVGTLEGQLSRKEAELEAEKGGRETERAELERVSKIADLAESSQRKAAQCEEAMRQAQEERDQAEKESQQCRNQAEKMLELTEQLSGKNSSLAAENNALTSKMSNLEKGNSEFREKLEEISEKSFSTNRELEELKVCTRAEIESLQEQLKDKVKREQELATEVEDERNVNKVLKKKHAASLKELKHELSLMKKRLDSYEAGTASIGSAGGTTPSAGGPQQGQDGGASMSSRASSDTSLDQPQTGQMSSSRHSEDSLAQNSVDMNDAQAHAQEAGSSQQQHYEHSISCVHNQTMIEKIVKLQRQLARRSEKIEFLEEHVKQLLEEMQKKSRIVQMYALREEAGALVPESVDLHKIKKLIDNHEQQAQLAQKGNTVMGSVFGGQSTNSATSAGIEPGRTNKKMSGRGMFQSLSVGGVGVGADCKLTLELSMEINGKLQAVLEDTLLKNITLKVSYCAAFCRIYKPP